MAAVSQSRGIACFGKRFVNQIRSGIVRDPAAPTPAISLSSRGVHVSVYDKNLDEHVHPTVVPDELIQPQSEEYWAPHPKTGVFGPASTDQNQQGTGFVAAAAANESGGSVLEEKAFFRPQENLEKPQPHP